jgi:GDPmannose 4,6-dehydratase
MKKKVALITDVTGQYVAYLSKLLLSKSHEVNSIKSRSSLINAQRIDHLSRELFAQKNDYYLRQENLTDTTNLLGIPKDTKPDEKYNLVESLHTFSSNHFVNCSIIRLFSLFWQKNFKILKVLYNEQ